MSVFKNITIDTNNPTGDAFGRLRVSNPETLFDSKQIFDNAPLFWDEELESGAGISTTYDKDKAATKITSTVSTAGVFTRQTFMRFNYQPGKSHLILMTGVLSDGGGTGVQARIGYFDDDNGIFFEEDEGVLKVCIRTSTSGSPVDTKVAQSSWNVDVMDGTGDSEITIDTTKTLIFFIDLEWLGVGRVRTGVVIGGVAYVVHEFLHSNLEDDVYMSTPNLPLRYQLVTTASSPSTTIKCICASVASEGGVTNNGVLRHQDSGSVSGLSSGTTYALIGIRLRSTHLSASILLEAISMISTSPNDQLHWEIFFNPTVAGTFTYTGLTNSAIEVATGSSSNTITGGIEMDGGYLSTSLPVTSTTPNALRLGAAIDGTVDEIVLCARPITNNITVEGSLTWRELS